MILLFGYIVNNKLDDQIKNEVYSRTSSSHSKQRSFDDCRVFLQSVLEETIEEQRHRKEEKESVCLRKIDEEEERESFGRRIIEELHTFENEVAGVRKVIALQLRKFEQCTLEYESLVAELRRESTNMKLEYDSLLAEARTENKTLRGELAILQGENQTLSEQVKGFQDEMQRYISREIAEQVLYSFFSFTFFFRIY